MKKIILIAIIVLIATSCIPDYQGNSAGPKVGVLGDSITYMSTDEINSAFMPDYQVSVSGNSGAKLTGLLDVGQEYANSNPASMVIELGTNDAADPNWDATNEFFKIADMVGRFPSTTCVYWVTVGVNDVIYLPGYRERSETFNSYLSFWAAQLPNMKLVDWNAVLDYLGRGLLLQVDGIHPNQTGQEVLAYIMNNSVNGGCNV